MVFVSKTQLKLVEFGTKSLEHFQFIIVSNTGKIAMKMYDSNLIYIPNLRP